MTDRIDMLSPALPPKACPECNCTDDYGHWSSCSRFMDDCRRRALEGRVENLEAWCRDLQKLVLIRPRPWWRFW